MTLEFFTAQMDRLRGLRFRPDDLTTHWEALHTLPEAVVEAAVGWAARTRTDFPAPIELREDADRAMPPRVDGELEDRAVPLAQPHTITVPQTGTIVSITREWVYYCAHCSDTGWRAWWCGPRSTPDRVPWIADAWCERRRAHGAHEWSARCACAESNPALVRKRAAQERYAAQGTVNRSRHG